MKKTVHEIYVRHDDHAFAFYNEVVFDNELRDMGFLLSYYLVMKATFLTLMRI